MKVLAMGIVSTFNSQRKYFHWASQVLAFFWCSFVTDFTSQFLGCCDGKRLCL